MAQPYVGEIRMFAGNFAPVGWMFCHGQLLPISENETLFQLIGTNYGGDGESTFALPDLRGRIPVHSGATGSWLLGEHRGSELEFLSLNQIPAHFHSHAAASPATTVVPGANLVATLAGALAYADGQGPALASPKAMAKVGQNRGHPNMMPFLCISFIISLFGIFPNPT